MSKNFNDLLNSIKENPYYSPTPCPFHYDNYCLCITNNSDNKRFHCLYDKHSSKWMSYNASYSCDIPEYFYDLIVLNKRLGSEYVLPFTTHTREQMGFTIGLYEMQSGLYTAKILKPEFLFETFLTFIVLWCEVCNLYGGYPADIIRLKFIYVDNHPVLVDVGKKNNEEREKIKNYNVFNTKKWNSLLDKRTTKDILHYCKVCHPDFFKKKFKEDCVLSENYPFSDQTHSLICDSRKLTLREILTKFKDCIPNLKNKIELLLGNCE